MTASAILVMVSVQSLFIIVTAYFFLKVLRYKPKQDDSFIDEN